jgi:hypothetical protein
MASLRKGLKPEAPILTSGPKAYSIPASLRMDEISESVEKPAVIGVSVKYQN